MTLYNLRSLGPAYSVTKFDADLNVESTYTLTPSRNGHFDCDCPAGSRSVVTKPCRHRLMLPFILPAVDTDKFYDFDTKKFCDPLGDLVEQEVVGVTDHTYPQLVGEALPSPNEPPAYGTMSPDNKELLEAAREMNERQRAIIISKETTLAAAAPTIRRR